MGPTHVGTVWKLSRTRCALAPMEDPGDSDLPGEVTDDGWKSRCSRPRHPARDVSNRLQMAGEPAGRVGPTLTH